MAADADMEITELRVDGGASRNDWLMTFQAGILGMPVRRPALVETTALGAAGLAGLSTGVWSSSNDFLQAWLINGQYSGAQLFHFGLVDVDTGYLMPLFQKDRK